MTRRRLTGRVMVLGGAAVIVLALAVSACGSEGSPNVSSAPAAGPAASPSTVPAAPDGQDAPDDSTPVAPAPAPEPVASVSTPVMSVTASPPSSAASRGPVTVTVLFDDHVAGSGVQAGHGFSCLIRGLEKTVLFDTGSDGAILLSNMRALMIEPGEIDAVVISHAHGDHTGGLDELLDSNPGVTVYYPATCSGGFVRSAQEAGATLAPVDAAVAVCAGLLVTAPSGDPSESALLVETARGQVLVTGCAHPGIVEMVKTASDLVGEPVRVVMGGFHLLSFSAEQVDRIIQELKDLGVEGCGPAHCTGETATARMKMAFGAGAVEMGVGASVTF